MILTKILNRAAPVPGVGQLAELANERQFAKPTSRGMCRGVFETFEAAAASAPTSLGLGYDQPSAALMYKDRLHQVYPYDYPVMFWLERRLNAARRVFDFGGHIGLSYYGYRKYLSLPADLRWTVYDVPAVVAEGIRFAEEQGVAQLDFTNDYQQASEADIFFASGSLQYLAEPLDQRLKSLAKLPQTVIVNQLPSTAGTRYFTLQNIGTAFCPYLIESLPTLLRDLQNLGYRLLDQWKAPEKQCYIPLHPTKCVSGYDGFIVELER